MSSPAMNLRGRQSGVVLLVTLIALVIMLIGALALMRSADATSVIAGNLAFKRDMTNQAERAAAIALQTLGSGALAGATAPFTSSTASNYSATILATAAGNRGIPNVLLNDSLFGTVGSAANDITDTTAGVTIRYVIDRMCSQAGAVDASTCVLNAQGSDKGGTGWLRKAGGGYQPVYRVSVRVSGPRNTQAFVQTTLAN